jgi:hypothetical protein
MNAPVNGTKNSTPRTMRDLFIRYLKKARVKQQLAEDLWKANYEDEIGGRWESETVALIASKTDPVLRKAIGEQQFAERLANMYSQAAILDVMGALLTEQRRTNDILQRILNQRF